VFAQSEKPATDLIKAASELCAVFMLINATMLLNFFRRRIGWKIVAPELLSTLFSGIMQGDYIDLLRKAQIEPTGFDRLLDLFQKVMMWSTVGSGVFLILLLLFGAEGRSEVGWVATHPTPQRTRWNTLSPTFRSR